MTAQQKDIGSGWGPTEPHSRRRYPAVPAHPRQPTPRLLGQLLCDYHQSLPLVEVDQAGDGGLSLGPLPPRTACRRHRRIAPTALYRRRCARQQGLVRPRDPSWCPVNPLFRRAARCWPSAGLLVGGQLACRQVTPGKPGCGLPLRGHRGPGPVRASVLLSRVLTEAGVTPAVHLRGPAPLAASPTHPVSASLVRCLQNSLCPAGRGEQTPTPVDFS